MRVGFGHRHLPGYHTAGNLDIAITAAAAVAAARNRRLPCFLSCFFVPIMERTVSAVPLAFLFSFFLSLS
ncbi:hypothetical protein F4779DRAFT_581177 [Xylariaceae sp. FL0662B]|nr:hypothetical protein F4779DRAFT_581177 [Xylariaceae sp. FL0662B]